MVLVSRPETAPDELSGTEISSTTLLRCVILCYCQKLAQNTKETNESTSSNPWFNYSHAHSGVVMSFFRPHVHSICTRQIITWGGSWYKIVSARVPACVCEGMSACMACVHIFASCMYRQYGSSRTSTLFWNQQHVTMINSRKEVTTTPTHVPRGFMNCKRDTV